MAKIVYESPADQAGFVQLPNVVLMDRSLSHGAKLCYALLVHFSRGKGSAFPGQARLGQELGVTERQVRSYLRELEQADLVATHRRGARTNFYVLLALGKREAKRAKAGTQLPVQDALGNSASAQAGNSGSAEVDVEKNMKALCESAGVRVENVRFGGNPVNQASFLLAAAALDEFNRQADAKLRVFTSAGQPSEAMKRVYGRVRTYPDIGLEKYADIIRRTLASRWWGKGDPSIGVVFGPNVFEDNIARSPETKTSKQQDDDDLNARLREMMGVTDD